MTELVFLELRHYFLFARSVQVNGQEADDNEYGNHAGNNDYVSFHGVILFLFIKTNVSA